MNDKTLPVVFRKPGKQLSRSQRKLKKLLGKMGLDSKELTRGNRPAWLAALATIAAAVAKVMLDGAKRRQLVAIAAEAKQRATDVVMGNAHSGNSGHKHHHKRRQTSAS